MSLLILVAGLPSSAQPPSQPGAETPDSLIVTLQKGELQQAIGGQYKILVFSNPYTLDVIGGGSRVGGQFTSTTPHIGNFTGIRLTLDSTGQFSGTDPCTNTAVTDEDIKLTSDGSDTLVLRYQEPHPVNGLPPDAVSMDPFTLDTINPIDMKIVFPVSNSVVCSSDTPPLLNVVGNNTDLTPGIFGIALDTVNNDYVVSSTGADRVTVYAQSDIAASTDGNVAPVERIVGTDTGLNGPAGVGVANSQIIVANNANNSITAYDETAVASSSNGDVPPVRTITGPSTGLNSPAGIYVDTPNNELAVSNTGSDSITIYPADGDGDVAPLYTISGDATGLSQPCGVYVDDGTGEIYVGNNGNNSVTVYLRSDVTSSSDGNVAFARRIQGSFTHLSGPCGVGVDAVTGQLAVASSANSQILFFNTTDNGNVYPVHSILGTPTLLSTPTALLVDAQNRRITVINRGGPSIQVYTMDDATPHLQSTPVLINSVAQQSLWVNYIFTQSVDRVTGQPLAPAQPAGYTYTWQVYDTRLRQQGNAVNPRLVPPQSVGMTLADGEPASNLQLECPAFTPFIILQFSTNCSLPPVVSPFPAQPGDYRVIGALFGSLFIKLIPLHLPPLTADQLPRLNMHLTLVQANSAIIGMDWGYEDGNGNQLQNPFPLIQTQTVQITLTRPIGDVDSCYRQVTGNAQTLVYSSGAMGADVRSLSDIKNNQVCDIFLNDVDTITLTATDSLGTHYVYKVNPS